MLCVCPTQDALRDHLKPKTRQVCRSWSLIINASVSLRYLVWLGIHGMADGDYAFRPRSAAERLEALLRQENAWATLDFRRFDSKQIHTEDRMRLSGDDAVERARGQRTRAEMTIQCDQLPSIISGTDLLMGHPISIAEPGLTFEDTFCETDNAVLICELR